MNDIPLAGGRSTPGVVRVGDTVRRPAGAHSADVHALLLGIERHGFAGAPRSLGTDTLGRDVYSYIPGDVPTDLGMFPDQTLALAARMLRDFHDATAQLRLRGTAEVVCHGDPSPCNMVFRELVPVALIDFDTAHPGARRQDMGYAAWLWLDMGNPEIGPERQAERLDVFWRAYQALPLVDAVPAVLDAQTELAARPNAADATRAWASACRDWTVRHRAAIEAAINHRRA